MKTLFKEINYSTLRNLMKELDLEANLKKEEEGRHGDRPHSIEYTYNDETVFRAYRIPDSTLYRVQNTDGILTLDIHQRPLGVKIKDLGIGNTNPEETET